MSTCNRYLFFTFLTLSIGFDIFSKYTALELINNKIPLLGNIVFLEVYKNTGIAFSLPLTGIVLKIVTIVLILGIFYYYFKEEKHKKDPLVDMAFGLILGGAIGNGIERIYFGEVTDFIGVQYFSIFNIADICITLGGILYLYTLYKIKK